MSSLPPSFRLIFLEGSVTLEVQGQGGEDVLREGMPSGRSRNVAHQARPLGEGDDVALSLAPGCRIQVASDDAEQWMILPAVSLLRKCPALGHPSARSVLTFSS